MLTLALLTIVKCSECPLLQAKWRQLELQLKQQLELVLWLVAATAAAANEVAAVSAEVTRAVAIKAAAEVQKEVIVTKQMFTLHKAVAAAEHI